MNSLIQILANGSVQDLPSIFGLFLVLVAFVTVIYWVFFTEEDEFYGFTVASHIKNNARERPVLETAAQIPLVNAVSREVAVDAFADEISAGLAHYDDKFSVVFDEQPGDLDNLQAVKGIGKVFESRLHQMGCFTYKQMANWSEDTCGEVSLFLKSNDRIFRENWLEQARNFHSEKYGAAA